MNQWYCMANGERLGPFTFQQVAALVMQGFDADSVKRAVVNNDMGLLKHSGLTSVQLHKPGEFPPPAGSSKPGGAVMATAISPTAGRRYGVTQTAGCRLFPFGTVDDHRHGSACPACAGR